MTSKNQFENQLRESLQYGFINHKQYQDKLYSPKIVLNKRETGENVLTEIQEQLETCRTFTFNVAFITEDGIAMLKTQLADLSRKDVSRLMCWDSDGTSTMFGYSLNNQMVPIFVNYHKTDKTNAEIQYEDAFINQSILKWFTTSRRTLQSKTERKIIEHQEQGIDLHLFIKKSDLDDPDHYYLGQVDVIAGTPQQERVNGQNIVTMDLALRESVPYELFHYFINE